jgi:hypothetical protein
VSGSVISSRTFVLRRARMTVRLRESA